MSTMQRTIPQLGLLIGDDLWKKKSN